MFAHHLCLLEVIHGYENACEWREGQAENHFPVWCIMLIDEINVNTDSITSEYKNYIPNDGSFLPLPSRCRHRESLQ